VKARISQKINLRILAFFSAAKSDRQNTIFTKHSTTNSPQKHHDLPPQFLKNPCKNTTPPHQKK
jgi:hypothetical protein